MCGVRIVLGAPIKGLASDALAERWRKVRKRSKGLETLSIEKRHELRKELKKLRYGVDFFGGLFAARKVKPFRKRLKTLQDVFGTLNDVAVAEGVLMRDDAPARDDPSAQRAVGRLLGARQRDSDHAWTEARADWNDLRALPRFWT